MVTGPMPVEWGTGGLVVGHPRRRVVDALPTRPRDRVVLRQGCHQVGLAAMKRRASGEAEALKWVDGLPPGKTG